MQTVIGKLVLIAFFVALVSLGLHLNIVLKEGSKNLKRDSKLIYKNETTVDEDKEHRRMFKGRFKIIKRINLSEYSFFYFEI
jgi:hypothetical protein